MLSFIPRSFRRTFLRPKPLLITLIVILLLDAYLITSSHPKPTRTSTLSPGLKDQKIFIASMARNSEYMLRLYWNSALIRLVGALGTSNVYVSILESGSQEDTKGALRDLETKLNELGVQNKIVLGIDSEQQAEMLKHVPEEDADRTGWIFTARGETGWELRRIPYLAELRNRVMQPLLQEARDTKFDKVLWINDVVFTTEDVMTLLSTRDGDYAAACSLDFSSNPETYYDTFALRDIVGHKTATLTYPYFQHSPSISHLSTLTPLPVQSCWNGIITLSSSPFYSSPPLKFRGIADTLAKQHLEASECCLIHADNPLSSQKGVWLNPNVRVAYNATVYSKVNGGTEVKADVGDPPQVDGVRGGDGSFWPGGGERWRGVWRNRVARGVGWVRGWSEGRVVRNRVAKWVREGEAGRVREVRGEKGVQCLVNEMQVLFDNGWQHV